jgi:hypothetical protein
MQKLDIRTLLAVLAMVNIFLSVVMVLYWRTQRVYPGFGLWTVCNATIALLWILFFLRGYIPAAISIIVPTELGVIAAILVSKACAGSWDGRDSTIGLSSCPQSFWPPSSISRLRGTMLTYVRPSPRSRSRSWSGCWRGWSSPVQRGATNAPIKSSARCGLFTG